MTALELSRTYLDDSANQVRAVLAGLDDSQGDQKAHPQAMSARETMIHLIDCARAAKHSLTEEGEYAWGSFSPTDSSLTALLAQFDDERAHAVAAVEASGDDKALKTAQMFLAGHEYYHVGQLATLRLAVDPDWDAYSIYR